MTTKNKRTDFVLGAVAYDAKVVTIWDGFLAYFRERDLPFDYVLYSNYERQVEAHLRGDVDIAWNSPLAWIEAVRAGKKLGRRARAIAMRDTDQDLTSLVLVRADSKVRSPEDLRGARVAVGAADSPQATLIPLSALTDAGASDVQVVRHDVLLGKHGDHIGGERDAARALVEGKVDAACILDANQLGFAKDGTLPSGVTRVLLTTERYDHCNFTVFDDADERHVARFTELLLTMTYSDPKVRPLLDMEGLKAWRPGRTEGYALLERAVDRFNTLDAWIERLSSV